MGIYLPVGWGLAVSPHLSSGVVAGGNPTVFFDDVGLRKKAANPTYILAKAASDVVFSFFALGVGENSAGVAEFD